MKIVYAVIATLLIAGGAGFYGGLKYQASKSPAFEFGTFPGNGQGGARMLVRGGGMGAGAGAAMRGNAFANGQILAVDGKTMTVKMPDGGSKIVFVTDTTQIQKTDTAKTSDLINEKYVVVSGNTNSDGSITATSIQLRDTPPPALPQGATGTAAERRN